MRTPIAGLALGVALVSLLAACTPASTPTPSGSPGASPSTSASPGPSESPSESVTPGAGEPIDAECLDLVSLDTMYSFDPNFAYDGSFTPAADSLAATAVEDGGVACGWVRETGGGEIVIAASKPGDEELDSRRASAGTADGDVYFELDGSTGVVQIFDGDIWITAASEYFASAADAAVLTDSVIAALK